VPLFPKLTAIKTVLLSLELIKTSVFTRTEKLMNQWREERCKQRKTWICFDHLTVYWWRHIFFKSVALMNDYVICQSKVHCKSEVVCSN